MTAKSVVTIMELLTLPSKKKGRAQDLGFQPVLPPAPIRIVGDAAEHWKWGLTEKDPMRQLP